MSKNNENKLVPKLRFPEFIKDKEWKEDELGKICDYWNGASHESGVSENGEYYLISLNSIDIDGNLKGEMKRLTYTDNSLKKNDLVMVLSDVAHGNFLGLTDIIPNDKYVLNQRMAGLRIKDIEHVNSFFLRSYINKKQKYFKTKGQGSSQLNLSKSSVTEFPVLLPTNLQEQQKIAACLSSLDDVITAESKKLEVLKEHKKGLLQNLFPQQGETVPKLRFKEFEDSGEWVSDILKNVFTIFQGFAFSSNDSVNDGVRWLKIADVGIQQMNHLSPSYLPYEFKDKYENFLIKEGDYVIALTRPILNKKLKISKVDNTLHNSLLNQRVGKLVSNKCIDFVYYLVQTSNLISRIEQNIAGSEPPNLSAQQIENIEVFIPSTKKEQQKIANTLSSIDDLINAQSQKIETLKLHKKGLLQGLFPDVNEHNG